MPKSTRNRRAHALGFALALVICSALGTRNTSCAAEDPGLALHHPDGQEETLSRLEEVQSVMAKTAVPGDWRLMVRGEHKLRSAVHLSLRPGQRLVIEGAGTEAELDLVELP
jgi:hypothetical protein